MVGDFVSDYYVGAEQVQGALNAYDKDLLCEYHYRFFKCLKSAQRTTDAELCVFWSKRRMAYPEICHIIDLGNNCGIDICQFFTW